MKKAQLVKFWKRLEENTNEKAVISSFSHVTGYPSGHTLRRYVQAYSSFKQRQTTSDICRKTGWKAKSVEKIREWWESEFASKSSVVNPEEVNRKETDPATLPPETYKVFTQSLDRHRRDIVQAIIPRIKNMDSYTAEPTEEHFKLIKSWYNRPWDNRWPISVEAEITGSISDKLLVYLRVEEKVEWQYLLQHFKDTPFQNSLVSWKKAMVLDIKSRLNLLNKIANKVQSELKLPIVSDLQSYSGSGIDLYYVFALYAEVLYEDNKGIDFSPVKEDRYTILSPDVVYVYWWLNVRPIIRSPDKELRERAINYARFPRLDTITESVKARRAYFAAVKSTADLKRKADEIRLAVAFPVGSECDGCRPWVAEG